MQITINLPVTLTAESREQTLTVETAMLPQAILESMIPHSFQQLLGDAAAGAGKAAWETAFPSKPYDPKNPTHKDWIKANGPLVAAQVIPMMQKRLDALLAGTWTVSRGGGVAGDRKLAILRLFRALMDQATLKRFNALAASDQIEKAVAAITDETAIAAEVAKIEADREAKAKADAARKAAMAELAKGVTFDF